jgi:hypothetical protein
MAFKNRDPRKKVFLPSRMRTGAAWVDACIHNVSARGLLVASDEAPRPGSYVEIRRGRNIIIGRAVWTKDRFFGVRTQDPIDLPALQREPRTDVDRPDGKVERRREERFRQDAATARTLERNRAISRAAQFVLVASAATVASAAIAAAVYNRLAAPLDRIQQAMTGAP